MTTKSRLKAQEIADLPPPPWARPLSVEDQDALIQEAEAEIDRGEGIPHAEAMRRMDAMIARFRD